MKNLKLISVAWVAHSSFAQPQHHHKPFYKTEAIKFCISLFLTFLRPTYAKRTTQLKRDHHCPEGP